MSEWHHRYRLATLTLFLGQAPALAQRPLDVHSMCPDSATQAAIVTGTVTDAKTGQPLPAVLVSTRAFCGQYSDSVGHFRLRVRPGERRIVPQKRVGFLIGEVPELVLAPSDSASVSIVLPRDPLYPGKPPALMDEYPAAWWPDWFYGPRLDALLEVAGLQRLDLTRLPEGEREVRVWSEIAIGVPKDLVIVKDGGAGVGGEAILYWPSSVDETDSLDYDLTARFGPNCKKIERGDRWVVCYASFSIEPDWALLLSDAGDSELWTLPDPFALPYEGWAALDGWSMTIEVRDGAHYRAYHYNNPDSYDWPETRKAVALMTIFNRLWQQVFE